MTVREKFTSPIDSKINKCFQWRMASTEFGYNSLAEMLDLGADTYLRFQKYSVPMGVYPKQHPSIKFWHVPWIGLQRVPFGNGPAFTELWHQRTLDLKHVCCSGDALKATGWNGFSEIFSSLIHARNDRSLSSGVCSVKCVL